MDILIPLLCSITGLMFYICLKLQGIEKELKKIHYSVEKFRKVFSDMP